MASLRETLELLLIYKSCKGVYNRFRVLAAEPFFNGTQYSLVFRFISQLKLSLNSQYAHSLTRCFVSPVSEKVTTRAHYHIWSHNWMSQTTGVGFRQKSRTLLYEENMSDNLDFPYEYHPRFCLQNTNEAECKANFREEKHHITRVEDALRIPAVFKCHQGPVCDGTEGLCILLKRFAFPCRNSDMIPIFGRPVPELCMINITVMDWVCDNPLACLKTQRPSRLLKAKIRKEILKPSK